MTEHGLNNMPENADAVSVDGVELALTTEEYAGMKALQQYILEIMKVVDSFCREHNLTYYLGEGSLLGAVRNGGFIFWDDDADILMPRADYEKFLELAKDGLPEGYALDSVGTNPNHWSIPSMIQMTADTEFSKPMYKKAALYNGPNIDIFPLDYVDRGEVDFSLRLRSIMIRTLKRALWLKTGIHTKKKYKTLERRLHYYYPSKLLSLLFSINGLHKRIDRLMLKTNDSSNGYLANFASLYFVDRELYPKEWFGTPSEIEFEGHSFFAPAQSEKVLTRLYGDYMTLPPIKERRSKHHFSSFTEV